MNDFFDELGELALGSRLKRLSDKLYADAFSIYKHFDLPIQPKWFSLLALLDKKKKLSVVEASESLRLSQPALSQFCKQLENESLIEVHMDENDSRRRVMSLTAKGTVTVRNMKTVWYGVEQAAIELCTEDQNQFYKSLLTFEKALNEKSLLQRTRQQLSALSSSDAIEFIPFEELLSPFFEVINTQWIETMFVLEEIDKQVLRHPQKNIIEQGGYIWFAKHPVLGIVGTCALLKSGDNEYELTKMGVLPSARGLKIGERLLDYVINQTKQMNAQRVYLLTNKQCESAIHLYEKLGFEHCAEIMSEFGSHYERCNVAMLYKGK